MRQKCTYSLNPFTVTLHSVANSFTHGSDTTLNITTQFQEHDGIQYPATQGKYLLTAEFQNSGGSTLEKVEQYMDILPGEVAYFNVSYAHRDQNELNIF